MCADVQTAQSCAVEVVAVLKTVWRHSTGNTEVAYCWKQTSLKEIRKRGQVQRLALGRTAMGI